MPVINGVYTKDFPALGRAPIDTDIIPIAEVANQITYKTTLGEIFNAKVFGTTGRLSKFTGANTLGNSILNEIGNAIHLTNAGTSFASFGIINPGIPGEPGVDNDAYIGSTINNDFTIRVNNVEAARFDTALRFKIANIQNADTDTDKFLVSDGGVVKYRTGTELRSDIGAGVGSVTSVGLTMPVAFEVANSPITSAGTLEVTAIGTASQYIRGDGQLATLPTGAGGGSAVNYYLNGSIASGVAGYQQMDNTAIIGTGTDFTLVGNGLIAQFLTDAGNPNRLLIPGGAWNLELFFQVSSSGGNAKFYVDLFKYDGTTFTSIASGVTNPEEITGGTSIDLYLTSLGVPETALLITDRLAIQVYIVDNSGGRTVTLHTEDNTLCQVTTTFAGGISALNGLTANTQYFAVGNSGTDFAISSLSDTHTFNLPTASATNRGALSSDNWSTFNNKIGGSGTTNYIPKFSGANSLINSIIYEDAGGVAIGVPFSEAGFLFYVNGGIKANGNSTINGDLTSNQYIVPGGTSSQFLKANGSLDTNSYALASSLSGYVPYTGATGLVNLGAYDLTVNGVSVGRGGGAINSNILVGSQSGLNNTTGSFNSFFGSYAGNSNTTGSNNSFFGSYAGVFNTTGSFNTLIGHYAGAYINSGAINSISTNSVYLGYDTRASANGNTNEIVIGDSARGAGSNSATLGNTSIATTILHGNTSIGYTTNPSLYKLDVNGTGRFSGTTAYILDINSTYIAGSSIRFQNSGNTNGWIGSSKQYFTGGILGDLAILANGQLQFGTNNSSTPSLTIASTGAATFSGTTAESVTFKTSNATAINIPFIYNNSTIVGYIGTQNGLMTGGGTGFGIRSETDMKFGIGGGTVAMTITSGGNVGIGVSGSSVTRLLIQGASTTNANYAIACTDSSANNLFYIRTDGLMFTGGAASAYNNATTGRSVVVESAGGWGYTSSTRESKTNIEQLSNISWIYNLNPVSFNYRKKDNKMKYTNESQDEKWFGLIAEEVEKVNSDLVFYNLKEDGTKELAGVEYNKLISVLIKSVQELNEKIIQLENK